SITDNFKKAYQNFNDSLQKDNRKDILNELIVSGDLVFGDTQEVSIRLDDAVNYYTWIKKTNDSLFLDFKKQLTNYKEQLNEQSKLLEVDDYLRQIEITKLKSMQNNIHETFVITEMRNILSIKNKCKHQITNGRILFFDTQCLEEWNKAEVKINEFIKNSNNHVKNL
ncbi:MAG: hypothetical protein Q8K02_08990, partial [Flavobacterium sp.]|nr:hypothetical protein [Flavobacterium sp.]